MKLLRRLLTASLVVAIIATGCKKSEIKLVELMGAGATFPMPLYQKMFDEYYQKTGTKINYQGIGSGGGIKQITAKTVDFGATDAFLSDDKEKEIGSKILHIPTCLGSVVVTYNIPENPQLKFDSAVLSDIFLGKIVKWNDPKISALNPDVKLPDLNITVVSRADGSGTSFIFTDYLSKVSEEFATKVGRGNSVTWPVGISGKGNPGVSGLVSQTTGAIGYVELIYALQNKMSYGIIKNKSGNFVIPSLASTSASAQIEIPDHTKASITDTDAPNGYPISSFTWILIYKEQNYNGRDKNLAKAVVDALWWTTHEGQTICSTLDYAPLPLKALEKVEKLLRSVTYDGKKLVNK